MSKRVNVKVKGSRVNVPGLVASITLSRPNAIYALFEAVSNAIHAIEARGDRNGFRDDRIGITVFRDKSQQDHTGENFPIHSIAVEDTGVGLDGSRYEAFEEAFTDFKVETGGKGLGHYSYIKVFRLANVESVFQEGEKNYRRAFSFVNAREDILGHELSETLRCLASGTRIHMGGIRPEYAKAIPSRLETIAERIVEHFLPSFVGGVMPAIDLRDDDGGESIRIGEYFAIHYKPLIKRGEFQTKGEAFTIQHIRSPRSQKQRHQIVLAGDGREVLPIALDKRVPALAKKAKAADGAHFYYTGFITGSLLDKTVNRERTGFDIPSRADGELELGTVSQEDVINGALTEVTKHLADIISLVEAENKKSTDDFIVAKAPYYRLLSKIAPEELAQIPSDLEDGEKELRLYKVKQELECKAKALTNEYLIKSSSDTKYMLENQKQIEDQIARISELSQGDLARYVVHRNIILSVLERLLEVGEDGKASLEESIHRLICPMRISDDGTMELESHNLWIIDERLAFHNYLSSDLPLSNVDPIESASGEEPDILIFDGPMSFTDESEEPYRKISIIEFKRPIKEAHSPKYNPLRQIRRYAVEILNGEVRKKGRRIEVSNEVRFFGYAIAEYSDSIDDVRKEWGHALLPNGDGSVGYGKDENILYEVIPYKRLLRDAKKRNAAFFRRLKL